MPLPSEPATPSFTPSPWKLFAWGVLLGLFLGMLLVLLSSQGRRYLALEDARTQVEVRRILGTCK